MANLCSFTFEWAIEPKPLTPDIFGETYGLTTIGESKWLPPIEAFKALKATGLLAWEEWGSAGAGYYDLKDGIVVNEKRVPVPATLKEALEAQEANPDIDYEGLITLLDD